MEKILFVALVCAIVYVLLRIRLYYRQKNRALLDSFLSTLSTSFHETKWKLLQNNAASYDKEKVSKIISDQLREDTHGEFSDLIINMGTFPTGFRYHTSDPGTNLFVSSVYKFLKIYHLYANKIPKKNRILSISDISDAFYNELRTMILNSNFLETWIQNRKFRLLFWQPVFFIWSLFWLSRLPKAYWA